MDKTCPFKKEICNNECALYIQPEELNETVKNKLASIGIIKRDEGICSFKNLALTGSRFIFENTITNPLR